MIQQHYTVSRSLNNPGKKQPGDSEWIGTFPSYIMARAFLSTVFHIQPGDRLAWGTNESDGYLKDEGRYYIMRESVAQ